LGIAILLIVILVPMSFSRTNYYEIGLKKSKITGQVNREKTYESGFHHIGPASTFILYPATVQNVYLENLSIWSKSSNIDAGTLLNIDVSFQYKIIPANLGLLYDKVGTEYTSLIQNLAIAAIKNEAVKFSADDYLSKRREIEHNITLSVTESLYENADSEVRGLQLREVIFPELFYERKLASAVQEVNNNAENYRKESKIIRGQTLEEVAYIENDAKLIVQLSEAMSHNMIEKSKNSANEIVQVSRNNGLKNITDALNFVKNKHVLSLDFMLKLERGSNKEYLLNFDKSKSSVLV